MKHALLGPSSAHRWLVCPGSVSANANKPHTSNPYALEGTSAHSLLEVCLRLDSHPSQFLGQVLEPGHNPINDDMAAGVQWVIEYIADYMARNPKAKLLVEQRVHYGPQVGTHADIAFGTSDVILDNWPAEVVALDYKHGTGVSVSVKDNPQLRLYMLGMREMRGKYQRYRAVIIQPRLPKRKPVQEAVAESDKSITDWAKGTVAPVVQIALADNAPRVAGRHCHYCHERGGKCETEYAVKQSKASEDFKDIPK